MSMERTLVELLERVNAAERWIERFGDSDRRMQGCYAEKGVIVDWKPLATQRGLGANFSRSFDPGSQLYGGGITIFQTEVPETSLYYSILPTRWTIPAKVGDVEPGIRFNFSDLTNVLRSNTTGAPIIESPADFYFSKDGATLRSIQLEVVNNGASQTADIGVFTIEGWQV